MIALESIDVTYKTNKCYYITSNCLYEAETTVEQAYALQL